jgi:hypothetical protein
VNLKVLTTNGDLSSVGRDGNAVGKVLKLVLEDNLAVANDHGVLTSDNDGEVVVRASDIETGGLHTKIKGLSPLTIAGRGHLKAIVHRDGVNLVADDADDGDLILVALTLELLGGSIVNVPLQHLGTKIGRVQVATDGVVGERNDQLVVTTDDALGLVSVVGVQHVDITREGNSEHLVTHPQAAELLVLSLVSELECLDALEGGSIPELGSLIGRGGQDMLVIRRPGAAIDTESVATLSGELTELLEGLTIKDEALLITTNGAQLGTIGREADAINDTLVLTEGLLEGKGGTLEPVHGQILGRGGDTVGTSLLKVTRETVLRVARDGSNRRSRIEDERGTKPAKWEEKGMG